MNEATINYKIESYTTREQTLFSASSYLADRFVPEPEKIILPAVFKPEGLVSIVVANHYQACSSSLISFRKRLKARLLNKFKPTEVKGPWLIDFRRRAPENWSHSLNMHIPLALLVQKLIKEPTLIESFCLLLDSNTPMYIQELYKIFGFEVLCTSNDVTGKYIDVEVDDWSKILTENHKWVDEFFLQTEKSKDLFVPNPNLPKKVFLSRVGPRSIVNESEIEEFLKNKGFVKIYPERLSPIDQIKLFIQATDIVAVHGAGMGPLLYRQHGAEQLNLVEIFTPGHMTKHFRSMADSIDVNWVGVRGRIEPKHVTKAYNFDESFLKYSLTPFYVDTLSLDAALEFLHLD